MKEADELHSGFRLKFHNALQDEVKNLAKEYGLKGEKEYRVYRYEKGKNGLIDVAWRGTNGYELLMEIDSSLRPKSIKKLLAASAKIKIWFYYGNRDPGEVMSLDSDNQIFLLHIKKKEIVRGF